MNRKIKELNNGREIHYELVEENDKKIAIKKTGYDKKGEEESSMEIEIQSGKKTKFVKKFFEQEKTVISIGAQTYKLDEILYDEIPVPEG
jgi:hypothetical protein